MPRDSRIDDTDESLLNILQQDGRTSNAELARQVGLAPSAVFERVKRLEERGLIRGYAAQLDPVPLGLGLLAFIFVRAGRTGSDEAAKAIAAIPEVLEVHHVAGEDCLVVKVRARDTADLNRVLQHELGPISAIRSTRTTIVLNTVKETAAIPLDRREVASGND